MAGKEERSSYLYWPGRKAGQNTWLRHIISPVLEERELRRVLHILKIKRLKSLLQDQAISFHFDNCFSHYIHNVCSFCLSCQLYWGIFFILAMYPSAYSTEAGPLPFLLGPLTYLLGEIRCAAHSPEENSSPHLRPLLPIAQILLNTAKCSARASSHSCLWRKGRDLPSSCLVLTWQRLQGYGSMAISSRTCCWLSSLMFF